MTAPRTLSIPADHDGDTVATMAYEIESFLDYEEQSGRLDDRTREAFAVALEVMRDVAAAYHKDEDERGADS